VCKKQFSLTKKQLRKINDTTINENNAHELAPSKKPARPQLCDYIRQDEASYLVNKMASNDLNYDMISVYAYIQADGFCYRNNTLAIYAETNRNV
jgi:hypothetical protein